MSILFYLMYNIFDIMYVFIYYVYILNNIKEA